jgi:(p)ppGpp synthase/HD superfamily hydrolase
MNDKITPEQRLLNEAIVLAAEVHVGQVRKEPDGRPYICHVLDVVNALPVHLHTTRLVAALHDTVEDIAPEKQQWLKNEIEARFGAEVLAGVEAMTHAKKDGLCEDEELAHYLEYIQGQVLGNPHAPAVKLADNYVNMKDRIAQFAEGGDDAENARKKLRQYASSIALLTKPEAKNKP